MQEHKPEKLITKQSLKVVGRPDTCTRSDDTQKNWKCGAKRIVLKVIVESMQVLNDSVLADYKVSETVHTYRPELN